jgi:hypothetical protein
MQKADLPAEGFSNRQVGSGYPLGECEQQDRTWRCHSVCNTTGLHCRTIKSATDRRARQESSRDYAGVSTKADSFRRVSTPRSTS